MLVIWWWRGFPSSAPDMMALTGTTDPGHMRDDLDVFDFHLDAEEIEQIERLALP